MQVVWLLLDVVMGVVLAGLVAPFVVAAVPDPVRGTPVLVMAAVACIVVVSILRRVVVGTPGARDNR
jgi:hypothetical protein